MSDRIRVHYSDLYGDWEVCRTRDGRCGALIDVYLPHEWARAIREAHELARAEQRCSERQEGRP